MRGIAKHVTSTYESKDDPQYFKISQVMEARPYEALITTIKSEFDVADTTDENDDVAFIHALASKTDPGFWACRSPAALP